VVDIVDIYITSRCKNYTENHENILILFVILCMVSLSFKKK